VPDRKFRIVICRGPDCGDRRGSEALGAVFQKAVDDHGVAATTEIAWQSCFGRCTQGPNVLVRELLPPDGKPTLGTGFATLPGPRGTTALYNAIDESRARVIVTEHVVNGRVARELIDPPGAGGFRLVPVASRKSEP
jgi:(2Fe-2S) ferredoxin